MKTSVVRIMMMLAVFSFGLIYTEPSNAQGLQPNKIVASIGSYYLQLSNNKTTNIIFPYAVKSVDRSSVDVIAQVVQGFGNVLQLKANIPNFKQTDVTVITSDGKFYSFLVDYNADPKVLNLSFINNPPKKQQRNRGSIAIPGNRYNDALLDSDGSLVQQTKSFLHKKTKQQRMKLRLAGIYLKDGLMWFKLQLGNQSQVGFGLDNIVFSVVDKKQAKRTARQEIQLQPVYLDKPDNINGKTSNELILAFKPVTIQNTKHLKIQISGQDNGRNLILLIKPEKLLRARMLKI